MPRFAITEKAGRIVAGHNNTGVGSVLHLSNDTAKADVDAGRLVALDSKPKAKKAAPAAPSEPAKAEVKPATE